MPDHSLLDALTGTDPVAFAVKRLGLTPDPQQSAVLRSRARRGILNCTRQWGKSTVTALKAIHQALTVPHSLTLVLSPSERQSAEFLRKASSFLRTLDLPVRGDGDNAISLQLPNGSRLIGLPGREDTIRGFSQVALLLIDEASRVPDELYAAVRPMLAIGNGALWLMSTPHGRRGFFYEAWMSPDEDWHRIEVPAKDCPRISASFLEGERRSLGERTYAQEYGCAFHDTDDQLIPMDWFDRALDDTIEPIHIDWNWNAGDVALPAPRTPVFAAPVAPAYSPRNQNWRPRGTPSTELYVGLDLGQRQDHSAVAIIEHAHVPDGPFDYARYVQPLRSTLRLRHLTRVPLGVPYPHLVKEIRRALVRLSASVACTLVLDATGVGAPVVDLFRDTPLPCTLRPVQITAGQQPTHSPRGNLSRVPKRDLVASLVVLLEQEQLRLSTHLPAQASLRRELQHFRVRLSSTGHDQYGAAGANEHDDQLLALALACYLPHKAVGALATPAVARRAVARPEVVI